MPDGSSLEASHEQRTKREKKNKQVADRKKKGSLGKKKRGSISFQIATQTSRPIIPFLVFFFSFCLLSFHTGTREKKLFRARSLLSQLRGRRQERERERERERELLLVHVNV